jgi:hypothetical protein
MEAAVRTGGIGSPNGDSAARRKVCGRDQRTVSAVGGRFGDKRVLRITEREVVLKGESGREVIKVMPSVEKIPAKKTSARKQRTTGTTATMRQTSHTVWILMLIGVLAGCAAPQRRRQ